MGDEEEDQPRTERFFTRDIKKRRGSGGSDIGDKGDIGSIDGRGSDEQLEEQGQCLTLRVLQRLIPCLEKKSIWEASQGDIEKSHEVEETKYPLILRILESKAVDIIFIFTCLASVYLFFFAEGFVIQNHRLSGLLSALNALFTLGLFGQWLKVLVESKYSKTNQGYKKSQVILDIVAVFPFHLIVLATYFINDRDFDSPTDRVILTISRSNYLLRLIYAQRHISNWENQLRLGDMSMFVIRLGIYSAFCVHILGCIWHRIACIPFQPKHFRMTPQEAATDACDANSWLIHLLGKAVQLAHLPEDYSVIFNHYLASMFWVVNNGLRYGDGDITSVVTTKGEIVYTVFVQIVCWVFILVYVTGTLTSLLIERDTERESYLTRRYAIHKFMNFTKTSKDLKKCIESFYDLLWERRKGVWDMRLIERLPTTMRSEVFYDMNKFVISQLPLLAKMEESVLMRLAVQMKHSFYLPGEILFRKNQIGVCFYYVIKGYLEILDDADEFPITNIRSGSGIGELYLMHPYPHSATVRCGSQCDIMVLTRKDFRDVISVYPELWGTVNHRIASRLDQSEIILGMADKGFTGYITALAKIHVTIKPAEDLLRSGSNIDQLPEAHPSDHLGHHLVNTRISVNPELYYRRYSVQPHLNPAEIPKSEKKLEKQRRKASLEEEAFATLESDINGAIKLVRDVGLVCPPLIVSIPTRFAKSDKTIYEKMVPTSLLHLIWKFWISFCILFNIWLCTYQWSFRRPETVNWSYYAHILDFFVILDFAVDIFQDVANPQKSLEGRRDIISKLKSFKFYLRILGFIPWEYAVAEGAGWNWRGEDVYIWFYSLKFNRLLEVIVVFNFYDEIGARTAYTKTTALFMIKLTIATFFMIHFYAAAYEVFRLDGLEGPDRGYFEPYYFATQVITATGYGDYGRKFDSELISIISGLIIGSAVLLYFGAKVTALLANSARRRLSFKHNFYSLIHFMKLRNFPDTLAFRITKYYRMQWDAHQGVLTPSAKSAIWDAPESISNKVTRAQALKYVSRIPLTQNTSEEEQTMFCKALRRYFVPPGETVLYAGDFRRELYIIVRGICQVFSENDAFIGSMGEGNYFGLPGLLFGVNRPYRIVTETHCQFFCLLYEDFLKLVEINKSLGIDVRILRGLAPPRHRRSTFNRVQRSESDQALENISTTSKNYSQRMESSQVEMKEGSASKLGGASIESSQNGFKEVNYSDWKGREKCWKLCRCVFLKFTIKTDGQFMKNWTIIRTLSAVLVTIFAFTQAAFAVHPTFSFFVMFVFDMIAYVDMYLMFHLVYFDNTKKRIEETSRTVFRYLNGPFPLDLICCFPLEVLVYITSPSSVASVLSPDVNYGGDRNLFLISYLRLNRMLQIYRLFTAGNYLSKGIFRSITFVTLVEIIPLTFVFINTLTCICFLMFCYWEDGPDGSPLVCQEDSWISMFRPLHPLPNEEGWITIPDYKLGPSSYYILSLWWVSQSAFRVGFGDFFLANDDNRNVAIVVILIGTIVTMYLGGKLSASSFGKDSRRIQVWEELKVLFSYMGQYNVSDPVQRRVKAVYLYNWDKNSGIKHDDFFVSLHPNLKADAGTHMYEANLLQCPLLKELENDPKGIRMLATALTEEFYPEGEYIMRNGDLNDDFFLITKGIIVNYKESGEIINLLGPGSLIGEISAILGVRRVFSAVAATNVDVFVFKRNDFLDFLELYPQLAIRLEFACIQHYRESLVFPHESLEDATHEEISQTVAPGEEESVHLRRPDDAERGEGHPHVAIAKQLTFIPPEGTDQNKTDLKEGDGVEDELDDLAEGYEEEEDLVGSYINLSEKEAKEHPEYIGDPLRIKMKQLRESKNDIERNLAARKWWSCLLTFGRIPRNEMGLLHICQEKSEVKFKNLTIHPLSPLCSSTLLSCLYLLIISVSSGIAAFEVSFKLDSHSEKERYTVLSIRYVLEIFFIIRFIGNFMLGYYDGNGVLVTEPSKIIKRYAKRPDGLILDILTTLPLNIFEFTSSEHATDTLYSVSSGLLTLKLLRIVLFVRYLKETETDLILKVSQLKIVKICIILIFIFHFTACIWYFLACYGFDCVPGSWVDHTISRVVRDDKHVVVPPIKSAEDFPIDLRYYLSLYYVTTIITFNGLNNTQPSTLPEIGYSIFLVFATVFILGYLVGEVTQCFASQLASKIHYQHELTVLEEHFHTLGLTRSKSKDVRKYYRTLWQRAKGKSFHDLLNQLPYPLRADIALEIYSPGVKSCRILSKVDEVILREICARIRHEIYLPGSHIVRAGEISDAMYFIKKGEVVILDENQNLELCVEVLYENECFGEIKLLLPREKYHFSYIARLASEIGVLRRSDFEDIFENYPTLKTDLTFRALKVKEHRTKQKEEVGALDVGLEVEGRHEEEGEEVDTALALKSESDTEVKRLSVYGGPGMKRMRAFSQSVRKRIDEKSTEMAKRGSGSSHSSQIH